MAGAGQIFRLHAFVTLLLDPPVELRLQRRLYFSIRRICGEVLELKRISLKIVKFFARTFEQPLHPISQSVVGFSVEFPRFDRFTFVDASNGVGVLGREVANQLVTLVAYCTHRIGLQCSIRAQSGMLEKDIVAKVIPFPQEDRQEAASIKTSAACSIWAADINLRRINPSRRQKRRRHIDILKQSIATRARLHFTRPPHHSTGMDAIVIHTPLSAEWKTTALLAHEHDQCVLNVLRVLQHLHQRPHLFV